VGLSSGDCGQQSAGLLELGAGGGTEEPVVTHLGKAAGQGVQEKAADKLLRRQCDPV